jgi:hypothetical protein
MEIRDFSITKGDTKLIDVSVTEQSDGTPTVITGAAISWKVAKSIRSTAVISKATSGSGISITSGTGGTFRITLDAADTSSLNPGDYYHEAQITFADSEVATVLKGVMTIEPGLV